VIDEVITTGSVPSADNDLWSDRLLVQLRPETHIDTITVVSGSIKRWQARYPARNTLRNGMYLTDVEWAAGTYDVRPAGDGWAWWLLTRDVNETDLIDAEGNGGSGQPISLLVIPNDGSTAVVDVYGIWTS
jgi:hypothetical protein